MAVIVGELEVVPLPGSPAAQGGQGPGPTGANGGDEAQRIAEALRAVAVLRERLLRVRAS